MSLENQQIVDMLKALSNETRLDIMCWLSNPDKNFKNLKQHVGGGIPGWGGACVGTIQEKAGLSQSTVSGYLKSMQQAGLLESKRQEKWTFYRINKESVATLCCFIESWRG